MSAICLNYHTKDHMGAIQMGSRCSSSCRGMPHLSSPVPRQLSFFSMRGSRDHEHFKSHGTWLSHAQADRPDPRAMPRSPTNTTPQGSLIISAFGPLLVSGLTKNQCATWRTPFPGRLKQGPHLSSWQAPKPPRGAS